MQFAIYEENIERIRKKMTKIRNKCAKYGCEFHYEEVGEEFREVEKNGEKAILRYIIIEAEGEAIVNGWRFVASVEHTENGNIIKSCCGIEVPERYYTSKPVCEHCHSNRYRKDTYIVMNEETGEFKQVGKSCLRDFTNGMSAEAVAMYAAAFDELIEGEANCGSGSWTAYLNTEEFAKYAAEAVLRFGYKKREDFVYSTAQRALDYYNTDRGFLRGRWADKAREEMEQVGFDAESEEAVDLAQKALEWVKGQEETSNYMHNLRTVSTLEYVQDRNAGILASLIQAYRRWRAQEDAREAARKAAEASVWVGNIGDKITIEVSEVTAVTGWETQWGYTRLYKIVDEAGNVYTWKTATTVKTDTKKLTGTVKNHTEFRGVKQTEITRCKAA